MTKDDARKKLLAAALRANLKRRKAGNLPPREPAIDGPPRDRRRD